MALIKCPECGNECSDKAEFCPKCGYPFVVHPENVKRDYTYTPHTETKPIEYETKIIKMMVVFNNSRNLNNRLQQELEPYTKEGWEYVSMTRDGITGPYVITIRRPKK